MTYVLAPHTDAALESLMQLLTPFEIERFYTIREACQRLRLG
ncbi:MAG: hypothetical protein AAF215_16590 [Cyanobacteria bacterium P01_A01_bin.123]